VSCDDLVGGEEYWSDIVEVMDIRLGKRVFLYTCLVTLDELEYHDIMALLCVKCPMSEFAPLGKLDFSGHDGVG